MALSGKGSRQNAMFFKRGRYGTRISMLTRSPGNKYSFDALKDLVLNYNNRYSKWWDGLVWRVIHDEVLTNGKVPVTSVDGRLVDSTVPVPVEALISTTNATPTTIYTLPLSTNLTYQIAATVIARRTGGSSGSVGDGSSYELRVTCKNIGGVATIIGSTTLVSSAEDQAGWNADFGVSGGNLICQVTGASNNNINWRMIARIYNL